MYSKWCVALMLMGYLPVKEAQKYVFCTTDCGSFESKDVKCVTAKKLDCMFKVNQGSADFATISTEDALLAANFLINLTVVANFSPDRGDSFDDDGVIVVRKSLPNGLKGLHGYKYCEPDDDVLRYVSRHFQATLLQQFDEDICKTPGETILEKHLKSFSELIGSSCLPGPWVSEDLEYDGILRRKLSQLQELCQKPSYARNGADPFRRSFDCFLDGDGDVALTKFSVVQSYVDDGNDTSQYRYLCSGDHLQVWDASCSWLRRRTLLITTNSSVSFALSKDLQVWFKDYLLHTRPGNLDSKTGIFSLNPVDSSQLRRILFPDRSKINIFKGRSLRDYLQESRGNLIQNNGASCGLEIKWCTVSDAEQEKCNWLSRATEIYQIRPALICVQKENSGECMKAIWAAEVDLAMVDIKVYSEMVTSLTALKYPILAIQHDYVVVVRDGLSANGNEKECDALSKSTNGECFTVLEKTADLKLNESQTILCENGSLVRFTEGSAEVCVWTIPSFVLVSRTGNPKRKDIEIVLSEIEAEFVLRNRSAFRLFGVFNDGNDLLFQDATITLSDERYGDVAVLAYNKLLSHLTFSNGARTISATLSIAVFRAFISCLCIRLI